MAKKYILEQNKAPEKMNMLTKQSMRDYIKAYGDIEDAKWYRDILTGNKLDDKKNNLTGKSGDGYEWAKIRVEFMKRFYKDDWDAKQAKKNNHKQKAKTPIDEIDLLIAEMEGKE